jgi:hypothetical protein
MKEEKDEGTAEATADKGAEDTEEATADKGAEDTAREEASHRNQSRSAKNTTWKFKRQAAEEKA